MVGWFSLSHNDNSLSPLIRARPQFRLLTPTMYRSRMATTRQTLSMDCGSSSVNLRPAGMTTEDSLELDLGASATHVTDNTGAHCSDSGRKVNLTVSKLPFGEICLCL